MDFIRSISKLVFLTMAGATDPDTHMLPPELSNEVSLADPNLSRVLSRPFVPCEEENYDFLSKKRKFE